MATKLKTKVALGGIFLFALLILVGAVSFFYFNRITREAREIVKNNYETLNYSREMLNELEAFNGPDSLKSFSSFDQNLRLQEKNVTEPGEKELTGSVRRDFSMLGKATRRDSVRSSIRAAVSAIMQLNLQAIDKKNQAAQKSAENAKTIIILILSICILTGITFIYNFPSLVASPIAKFTEGIKAIADRNYGERIHLNRTDEFGQLANAFNSMAEKLDQYEHSTLSKIMFEKQRAETVINSLKDASIGIDNKGNILFANEQALQLLSLQENAIVGHSTEEVLQRNDLFRFLINEQNNTPFKIVVDGKENYFTKEMIDISQGKEKAGIVIVLKNITSFKELDVAKNNFIATVSHELKTPLASSDFSLKLLEDNRVGQLSKEQRELIQQLKNDNQRMLKILSELLNLSQVEAGKIQLNISTVHPDEIVQNSINVVGSAAKERQITIQQKLQDDLPLIKADPDKIGWVLNNFLTNAIKFSPEESIVTIQVEKSGMEISFSVSDKGSGVAEPFISRIFDRYFQVPGRSDKKGSGIGLAICKDFIEAMGGKIWVKSEPGLGSTFGFNLPVGFTQRNT